MVELVLSTTKFLAVALLLCIDLVTRRAAVAERTFRGSRAHEGSPMGALATATELLNGIGEPFDENEVGMEDAETLLLRRRRERLARRVSTFASNLESSSTHEPHFSLFAPHHDSVAFANQDVKGGAMEMRFRSRAPEAQPTTAARDEAKTNVLDLSKTDDSQSVDVVGSFSMLYKRGETNRLLSSGTDLARETNVVRHAVLDVLNEGGATNPVPIHMIEVRIAAPPQPPPTSNSKLDAKRERERMMKMTFNVALRGISRMQAMSAVEELNGSDFEYRVFERIGNKTMSGDESEGDHTILAGHIRLIDAQSNASQANTTGKGFGAVALHPSSCPFLCSGNGMCQVEGHCQCFPGFANEDCSELSCLGGCGEDKSRGVCVDENRTCSCKAPYFGKNCELTFCPRDCSYHGLCNNSTGRCECLEHWSGEDCGTPVCPQDCSGHGECRGDMPVDGREDLAAGTAPGCDCDEGWTGEWCASPVCPLGDNGLQCSGNHFSCANRSCICKPGFKGEDCSEQKCPDDCSNHGSCVNFACQCNVGWQGVACNYQTCAPGCEAHGTCQNGTCTCSPGFEGVACDRLACPDDCHGRGACINTPECVAHDDNCHHGDCEHDGAGNAKCNCFEEFTGNSCNVTCPVSSGRVCGGPSHGKCLAEGGEAVCMCEDEYGGAACESRCTDGCNAHLKHGKCQADPSGAGRAPMCVCNPGFRGTSCSELTCPKSCSGHGACSEDGTCVCDRTHTGEDCSDERCPLDCSGQGECEVDPASGKMECVCDDGWVGDACHERVQCPNRCSGHGECTVLEMPTNSSEPKSVLDANSTVEGSMVVFAQCHCDNDWYGLDCSKKNCLRGFNSKICSGHGSCNDEGICECNLWFSGGACEEHDCSATTADISMRDNNSSSSEPKVCSGHGICEVGTCICDNGYTDSACSIRACPQSHGKICGGRGTCDPDGTCACESEWHGEACQLKRHVMAKRKSSHNDSTAENPLDVKDTTNRIPSSQTKAYRKSMDEEEDNLILQEDRDEAIEDSQQARQTDVHTVALKNFKFKSKIRQGTMKVGTLEEGQDNNNGSTGVAAAEDAVIEETGVTGNSGSNCPNFCSDHGDCNEETGECSCHPTFQGVDCSFKSCSNCVHGVCQGETCVCDNEYFGESCEFHKCPGDCSGHGECLSVSDDAASAACDCKDGWSGIDCSLTQDKLNVDGNSSITDIDTCNHDCADSCARKSMGDTALYLDCFRRCSEDCTGVELIRKEYRSREPPEMPHKQVEPPSLKSPSPSPLQPQPVADDKEDDALPTHDAISDAQKKTLGDSPPRDKHTRLTTDSMKTAMETTYNFIKGKTTDDPLVQCQKCKRKLLEEAGTAGVQNLGAFLKYTCTKYTNGEQTDECEAIRIKYRANQMHDGSNVEIALGDFCATFFQVPCS